MGYGKAIMVIMGDRMRTEWRTGESGEWVLGYVGCDSSICLLAQTISEDPLSIKAFKEAVHSLHIVYSPAIVSFPSPCHLFGQPGFHLPLSENTPLLFLFKVGSS